MPEVILWDLMDTLVRDPFFTHMPGFFGLSFEQLVESKHPTTWGEFELGRISELELYARFFRDGRVIDGEGLKSHMRAAYRWIDGMEAVLRELQARRIEMHLLSNYPEWYRLCDEQLGVFGLVQPSFVSCKTGVRKPAADAYLGACRALDKTPAQCLFVDDREANCIAARAVGMDALRFDGDLPALRRELATRRLL
jgi:HAD superfamily hydrolase (TIGR01509 family)